MKRVILKLLFRMSIILIILIILYTILIYFNGIKCSDNCAVEVLVDSGINGVKQIWSSGLFPIFLIIIIYQLVYILKLRRK